MIRLFLKFLLLMAVAFLAGRWTFYRLLEGQVFDDRQRVVAGITKVHLGGLRIVASELGVTDEQTRKRRWDAIQEELDSPLEIRPTAELSAPERLQLEQPSGFVYTYRNDIIDYLGVGLDTDRYLRLGPIAENTIALIEQDVAGWLRILARKMEGSTDVEGLLRRVSTESPVPVRLLTADLIPHEAQEQLASGKKTSFYGLAGNYYVAMPIKGRNELLSLGPLPKVKDLAQQYITRAMAIWYAIVMGATGSLVYSVSKKFRRIELAVRKIAEGSFDSRVDESNAGESKVLASAFNLMASKMELSIRSKKELLQVVSHELRTPLSRLRFAIELLDSSSDPGHNRSRMMVIRQSIDNLDTIVDEVLDYVRTEDDSPKMTREWMEIQPGLKPMIQVLQIEHPKLQFEWVFSGISPCTDVYADRITFHRAIGNLLSNAVRYAKSKVRIHVYRASITSLTDEAGSLPKPTVCIEIEDDGPGIPVQKRIEVMSPFVRLSPHESVPQSESPPSLDFYAQSESISTHAGLGLGLTIVERSIKQHGGSISIHQGGLGGCLVQTHWPIPTTP